MKALKITLPIALVLIALLAIFFLAPLKEWKEWKNREKEKNDNIYYIQDPKEHTITYAVFCALWWKKKFKGDEYETEVKIIN